MKHCARYCPGSCRNVPVCLAILGLALGIRPVCVAEESPAAGVNLLRVPGGGLQPRVAVEPDGSLHMIYLTGDPAAADILYVRSVDGGASFSPAIRVNSGPASAVAIGNVRGPQIALGREGRVHVAWMGSSRAEPRGPGGATPMLVTRSRAGAKSFEPERNVITGATGLDGGGTIAADPGGNVYVVWHAPAPRREGEENRRVWVAASRDGGQTFAAESPAFDRPTGACACCGISAIADRRGALHILFRSARDVVHRDMFLLRSSDGRDFRGVRVHPWNVSSCVMSTSDFWESPEGSLWLAWETREQVYFSRSDPDGLSIGSPVAPPGPAGRRKHPVLATDVRGTVCLAWTEGMRWKEGGYVAWQVFDETGKPLEGRAGRRAGVPAWSLVAVVPRPRGGFTVIY